MVMGASTEVGADVVTGTDLVPVTKIVRENLGYIVCAKHTETGEIIVLGEDSSRSGAYKAVKDVVDAIVCEDPETASIRCEAVASMFETRRPPNVAAGSVHIRELAADVDAKMVSDEAMHGMKQRNELDKALTAAKSAKGQGRISSGAAAKFWNELGAAPVQDMFSVSDLQDGGHIVTGYIDRASGKPYYLQANCSWPSAAATSLKANRFSSTEAAGMALVGFKDSGQGMTISHLLPLRGLKSLMKFLQKKWMPELRPMLVTVCLLKCVKSLQLLLRKGLLIGLSWLLDKTFMIFKGGFSPLFL